MKFMIGRKLKELMLPTLFHLKFDPFVKNAQINRFLQVEKKGSAKNMPEKIVLQKIYFSGCC